MKCGGDLQRGPPCMSSSHNLKQRIGWIFIYAPFRFQSRTGIKKEHGDSFESYLPCSYFLPFPAGGAMCQKGVVLLSANATLTGYLSQYPNHIIQFSIVSVHRERQTGHLI